VICCVEPCPRHIVNGPAQTHATPRRSSTGDSGGGGGAGGGGGGGGGSDGRPPAEWRYRAGRARPPAPAERTAAPVTVDRRRVERAGQSVGQGETAAAARALPPPPFVAGGDRRTRRRPVVVLVISAVERRSFTFAGLGRRSGRRPGRPPQPDVRQPLGQRRHDAEPVAVVADERAPVVHADLVHVLVDQPGRAQVAQTGGRRARRPRRRQVFVRQLNRFFGRRHRHAQLLVGRGTGDFRRRRRCGNRVVGGTRLFPFHLFVRPTYIVAGSSATDKQNRIKNTTRKIFYIRETRETRV